MTGRGRAQLAWGDLAVVLAVLVLAAASAAVALPDRAGEELTAVVTLDGEKVFSRPLAELAEPAELPVEGPFPLTLELSAEGVRVVESSCPGEDCRHTGTISAAGEQIVCLPGRLVAAIEGASPSYDAVLG